jgi:hypothetical protein
MSRLALSWIVSTLLFAGPAMAQVYKWVDESGKVNYGDKPPLRTKGVQPLGEGSGSVSVVSGIPKEELDRLRQQNEAQRLERLEREVEELRAQSLLRVSTVPETVHTEVYVPTYGYLRPLRRTPGSGYPGLRPVHPIGKPGTPARPRHRTWP